MLRVTHLLAGKGKDLWSVDAEQPVLEAIQIMADRRIGALPVMRGGSWSAWFRSVITPAR